MIVSLGNEPSEGSKLRVIEPLESVFMSMVKLERALIIYLIGGAKTFIIFRSMIHQ